MIKNKLKILLFSDTHGKELELILPSVEVDIAIFAGDAGTYKNPHQNIQSVLNFIDWYASVPNIKHKIWIGGNHCTSIEAGLVDAKTLSKEKSLIYLEDETIEIDGLKIFGSPWSPWFHSWAFNAQRGEEINKHWQLIESNTDIIITHGPPASCDFLDRCMDGQKVGCSDLTKKIVEIKPSLVVCGHIHEGYGYTKKEIMSEDGESIEKIVTIVNASVLNHRYEMTNKPVIVELDENREVNSVVVDYEN
jgi:Icc-related predicted phosphoesterase